MLTSFKTGGIILKSKFTYLILTVVVFALILCGCQSEPGPKDIYDDYVEMAKVNIGAALCKYCYYERTDIFHMVWDTPEYMESHRILSWEQLSDDLWAVRMEYTSSTDDGATVIPGTNFVGMFNGTYKVMISIEEVPEFLTEGLDLEEYYQERIGPEDGSWMPI